MFLGAPHPFVSARSHSLSSHLSRPRLSRLSPLSLRLCSLSLSQVSAARCTHARGARASRRRALPVDSVSAGACLLTSPAESSARRVAERPRRTDISTPHGTRARAPHIRTHAHSQSTCRPPSKSVSKPPCPCPRLHRNQKHDAAHRLRAHARAVRLAATVVAAYPTNHRLR